MTTQRIGDWVQVYSGAQFWPLDPRPEEVHVIDIIHSLSLQPRFAGHTNEPYSVAQHSVYVSHLAEERAVADGKTAQYALNVARWGLIHDASEAYLVDVPRPVKMFLAGYREAEAKVMAAICVKLGLDPVEPDEVRAADEDLLATEAAVFFPVRPASWRLKGESQTQLLVEVWDHKEAAVRMAIRWQELFGVLP